MMTEVSDLEAESNGAVLAIEALYRAEAGRLFRSLLGAFADQMIAEEAVAEAFAQLIRRGDGVRDPRAWVWRTAFAVARGMARDRGRRHDQSSRLPVAVPVEDVGVPIDLFAALGRLSTAQREAVVLRYWAGFSAVEIGRFTSTDPATVRVRLARARRRLRKELEDQ